MIQEKDFLYRVPVKNALVTAPGKQVRNPEILVDLEGGEFTHGDILDANSTNKLIDQSVKDAIDNSIENGNYVTKDLLEAETSARTKSDEDLSAKIKAEQTRAEGKEKEISDKLANEVTIATGVVSNLQAAIDTKADSTELSNYVLTTALNKHIDTLNTAISAKQDSGNYIPYDSVTNSQYSIGKDLNVTNNNDSVLIQSTNIVGGNQDESFFLNYNQLRFVDFQNVQEGQHIRTTYSVNGITSDNYNNCLATSDGTFKPISDFALKTELPTVPTKVSQLTNDSNFITYQDAKNAIENALNTVNNSISSLRVGLSKKQDKITVNSVDVTDIETADITKLRTIVRNLIDALNTSGLIRTNSNNL